ncbi:serine/threonine-protein kinase [Mesorhizobium sp. ES1-3]|uniref:serine/threonine-protein kinase n=1 Tax=Mesorhizobium sp. ES1-3 TaxID=2876628 RepID=UPI001CCE532B|nr:serine/threonine-protein kinase [Mesorhizobium sp. ES1-3]MBZ9673954.1 serine/threonine protein kinase [Mesorhizobium sp. ES1-3]
MKIPARYVSQGKSFGNGGMGEAALYKDIPLDRLVVIKSLKAHVEKKRLLDEISALQSIRSKHVVQIYDVIPDAKGDLVGLVEEYLDGNDLTDVKPPNDLHEFLKIAFPIARGISDIHAAGRIHRDIKRQNMKFDGEGCLKIFDFGLSRTEKVDANTVGQIGTRGYMAPELFIPDASGKVSFTRAVDVFAFGSTCMAISLGKLPVDLKKLPPALPSAGVGFKSLPFALPADILMILDRCFSVAPAQRPSMAAIADLMGRHLLKDRHRALLVHSGVRYVLDAKQKVANLSVAGQGAFTITYDGFGFVVGNVAGSVFVNNMVAANGMVLPGACVIVLGAPALGTQRTSITVDISHPEVST